VEAVTLGLCSKHWSDTGFVQTDISSVAATGRTGLHRLRSRKLGDRMIRVRCLMPGLTAGEAAKDVPQLLERTMPSYATSDPSKSRTKPLSRSTLYVV
jgi:hypothetical protein